MSLNQLRLIGVDGYRLAIRTETVKYDGEDISFIVPKKTVRELIKLLNPEEDENISVSVGKRHIVFEVGQYSIISRLLEGEFLDYNAAVLKAVIPRYLSTPRTPFTALPVPFRSLKITKRTPFAACLMQTKCGYLLCPAWAGW